MFRNIKCKYDTSPLHHACDNGNINSILLLIDKGAEINCIDDFNHAPINHAINRNHIEVIKLLLTKGSNFKLNNNIDIINKWTPTIDIINKWTPTMVIILLQELSLYNEIGDLSVFEDLYQYLV